MNLIFFDTETTGLPKNHNASMKDLENWPRVIQLGWMIADETGAILSKTCELIIPDGWEVPDEKFWIENGHSTERCLVDGVLMPELLDTFCADLSKADGIVAHNMSFDYNVIGAEMIRYGIKPSRKTPIKKYCTKELSVDVCKLPGKYGAYAWPRLIQLHTHLFGIGFEGAHDAMADVIACKNSFYKMVELGHIKL